MADDGLACRRLKFLNSQNSGLATRSEQHGFTLLSSPSSDIRHLSSEIHFLFILATISSYSFLCLEASASIPFCEYE